MMKSDEGFEEDSEHYASGLEMRELQQQREKCFETDSVTMNDVKARPGLLGYTQPK